MCNIKDQIVTLLKQRHHSHKVALEQEKDPRSKHAIDLIARIREDSRLIEVIDSLPEEKQPEDLEEAAEKFSFISEGVDSSGEPYKDYDSGKLEGFIAGAEWQKEHSFKPTQEQLNALDTVYKTHGADSACRHVILNLLNQLKEP